MPTPEARAIAREVLAERDRQDAKWGRRSLPAVADGTGPQQRIQGELVVDVLEAVRLEVDNNALDGTVTYAQILHEEFLEAIAEPAGSPALRAELVQVAAVAMKWLEGIDLRSPHPSRGDRMRRFLPAHAYVVFLLSETAGATHTRLERLWAQKSARTGELAWPFASSSGLRTRVSELVAWGLVEWSGDMGRTVANRPTKVWRLTGSDATQVPGYEPGVYFVLRKLRAEAGSDLVTVAAIEGVAAAAGIRL